MDWLLHWETPKVELEEGKVYIGWDEQVTALGTVDQVLERARRLLEQKIPVTISPFVIRPIEFPKEDKAWLKLLREDLDRYTRREKAI